MKRVFLKGLNAPKFDNMTDEQFFSALRVYSAKLDEESKTEYNTVNTSISVPRSAGLNNDLQLPSCNKIEDIKESAYEYFLAVRARKIVYDAIGKKSDYDIKRLKAQFPDEEELIDELEKPTLNLPAIKKAGAHLPASAITDFSAYGNQKQFAHSINCNNHNVVQCISEYIRYKSISVKKRSLLCHYPSIIYYILRLEFENNITLMPSVIGNPFLTQFEQYLRIFDLSTNTIRSMISTLKTALKWAALYGANLAIDLNGYKLKETDKRPKISLTYEEICKIYYFDFNNLKISDKMKKTYDNVRDHFILSCYIGQRFGDTVRFTKKNFGNNCDKFKITQQKTGNKAVVEFNKIYGEYPVIAREILKKYDYNAPYTGTMSTFNTRLHEICMYAGLTEEIKYETKINGEIKQMTFKKYELVTSHCARRTFITGAVKRGLHTEDIKHASGHTTEKSFGKYVIWNDEAD